jgi:ferredoxin/flavodoxin
MKTVRILCFSGTGNTEFVVRKLVEALQNKGVDAAAHKLEKLSAEQDLKTLLEADLIGIAFPVHAFNPPPLVEHILRKLYSVEAKRYFILKTSGSSFANGGTTSSLKNTLRRKNWQLQYETLVPMPSNFMGRYPDKLIKLAVQMAIKQTELIATDLMDEDRTTLKASRLTRLSSFLMRIERLGARFYGRFLKVEANCTSCGKCVRDCPTGNITMQSERFKFGWKCTFCMRCSFCCPVQAFTHRHLGKLLFVKPPYDLEAILKDPKIEAADLLDDTIPNLKEFRQYWFRAGVLD